VAVNLAGLKVSDLERGHWAAAPGSLENSRLLDVVIEIDKNMEREIKNNSRLHLYHGTGDVLCNLLLLEDKTALTAGQRAYGQLRLASPIAAKIYDRFVLRFYSPMETVGGGIILDPVALRMKRNEDATFRRFEAMEKGTLEQKIETTFAWRSQHFPKIADYRRDAPRGKAADSASAFDETLQKLIQNKTLINLGGQIIVHRDYVKTLGTKAQNILNRYHAANPLHEGMSHKELISRFLPRLPAGTSGQIGASLLDAVIDLGMVKLSGQSVAHKDFTIQTTADHSKIETKLLEIYRGAGFAPPDFKDVTAEFSKGQLKEKKAFEQMFAALVSGGTLVALTPQIHIHKDYYEKAWELFVDMASDAELVLTKDYRDNLGTSRKYAMAILEYFDKKGLTKMEGEGRVLL
jgi:selenocysteine-specific elongation factor